MKAVLTDKWLERLKPAPAGKRLTYWDGKLGNFGARVTDKGVVSFIVMRRMPGKPLPVRVTLGRYPAMKLADARRLAGGAIDDLAQGQHPRERQAAESTAKAKREADTVELVARRFLDEHIDDIRTAKGVRQLIEKRIIGAWGTKSIGSITKADILELVTGVRKDVKARRRTAGIEAARQVLIYTKSFFAWAADNDTIAANPAASIKLSGKRAKLLPKKKDRERVLTDAEIKTLWNATGGNDFPTNPFIRLLLIFGCRRGELAGMRRDELDLDAAIWSLPGDRTKNEDPRSLPLPKTAVDILRDDVPEFTGPFVFTTTSGQRPISGFTKIKARLDKAVKIAPWTLHDLRRTMRTNLSALGVPHLIAELAIGHKMRGVHGIYDRHRYESEIREALEKWCSRLRDITSVPPTNVARIDQARARSA